ncbi:MAG: N-acetyl-gamma-glutamyl-phosphate reductase [Gemmatimonadaceae bacterium]
MAHPRFELAFAAAHARAGETTVIKGRELRFLAAEDAALSDAAVVFSALPHGHSAPWVARSRAAGAKVVDLSADLRPGSGSDIDAPYGLPEVMRSPLVGAEIIANPGCYPTAILVALAPLAAHGLIAPGSTISVSAASGTTGAGATPRLDLLFSEVTDNFRAYGSGNAHRHVAEMRTVLVSLGVDADLVFTPHLLPVARGILATITVTLTNDVIDPLSIWRDHYAGEPFVEVSKALPELRDVAHRNVVRISAVAAAGMREPTLVVFAAIDNLVKGAAGQAIQNANIQLGLEEALGLPG